VEQIEKVEKGDPEKGIRRAGLEQFGPESGTAPHTKEKLKREHGLKDQALRTAVWGKA